MITFEYQHNIDDFNVICKRLNLKRERYAIDRIPSSRLVNHSYSVI